MYLNSTSKLLAALGIALATAACQMQKTVGDKADLVADETKPPARTFVYECEDGFDFTARFEENAVWLFLPTQAVQLPRARSDSGVKYSGSDITFWPKGQSAIIETANASYVGCQNNPAIAVWEHAKLNGVDFRATGNEPGWNLEIQLDQDIVFVADYGTSRYRFPTPEPDVDELSRITTYASRNEKHQLTVQLEGRPCVDSMSGDRFEVTVTVLLDDRQYQGCGNALH